MGADAPDLAARKANVFAEVLASIVAVERWDAVVRGVGGPGDALRVLTAVAVTVGAALVFARRRSAGLVVVAAAVAVSVVQTFPATANHFYFELFLLGLLVVLRTNVEPEARLLTASLRFALVVGLFYAGLQKVLFGYYFGGEFLAFAAWQSERFATVLAPLMPAAELARLRALALADGAGPFRVASTTFVLASNVAWLAEFVLPAMLLVPRLRKLAVVLVLAYFAAIESAAREVFFGGIMAALALLFWPGDALGRARPVFLLVLVYLAAMAFGLLPRWQFT